MRSGVYQYSQFIFIALGIYCIVRGIMTLSTGNLTAKEEEIMKGYSEKGQKRFRMLSALSNILGGVVVCALSAVRIMNLTNSKTYLIILGIVIVIMVVVYFVVRNSCKKV